MLLYLIRHAEAELIGLGGVTQDFDRPLTNRGREQARSLAQALMKRQVIIDGIAASPLVRAYQTAIEFLSVISPGMRPTTCDHLAIGRLKRHQLSSFLAHLPPAGNRTPSREEKSVVAIGHMPDLAAYLEWLIGAASGSIHIPKAGVACVQFETEPAKASGQLLWLVPPEWC